MKIKELRQLHDMVGGAKTQEYEGERSRRQSEEMLTDKVSTYFEWEKGRKSGE